MAILCFFFISAFISLINNHLIIFCFAKNVHNSTTDKEALLAFRARITSDPNNILINDWLTNTSICHWRGVFCHRKEPRVTALDFSYFGFSGTISPHIGNLTFLNYFDVSNNQFTGVIPPELSQLRRLKVIDAGFNDFSGQVPSWLGVLPEIRRIALRNNSFSGAIPRALLYNNSHLQELDIGYNLLIGNIPQPQGITNHTTFNLTNLFLMGNQLTGSIPFGIFNISSLQKLLLNRNRLSGSLPKDMCNNIKPELRGLYLSYNQLSGQIPPSIQKCKHLEEISLSYNHFNGSIPGELGSLGMLSQLYLGMNDFNGGLPLEIGNLSHLELLSMPSSSLIGPIPSFIFNHTKCSLKALDFDNNSLSGSLPLDMFRCKTLEIIYLERNKLTGDIPVEIGNLTRLKGLDFGDNELTGQLPSELGNLINLKELDISVNGLSGSIPPSIFNISAMTSMDLGINQFSGQLPATMGLSLPNLKWCTMSVNRLSGVIPVSITNASKLTDLEMLNNSFTGTIPDFGHLRNLQWLSIAFNNLRGESWTLFSSLTNCRYLGFLDISYNPQISGTLPASIGNLSSSLQFFNVDECNFRGAIPTEIGNLSSLQQLFLSTHQLTGSIPRTIGELKLLQRLNLYGNKLDGNIPMEFCQSSNLGVFDLSDNLLSGPLPSCLGELKFLRTIYLGSNKIEYSIPSNFWNLKDLLTLDLSHNSLSGSLPSEIGNLKVMNTLDLSWNQISGNIPTSIGSMESLVSMSFAHNILHGSLPETLGSIRSMESLDLSYNNFSGLIPKSLETLNLLQHFDVSHNKLEGMIPEGGHFRNFSAQSFMLNYALCSDTRGEFPHCTQSPKRSRSKNDLSIMKFILPLIIFFILAATITLFVLIKRRKPNRHVPPSEISLSPWRRISYWELREATNAFSESNMLGIGSFGSVYVGTLSDGLIVAIKVFNLQSQEARATKSFVTESKVLSTIRHRNLIKIIGCCSNSEFKALILEYMPNGSLEKWLYSHNNFLDVLKRLNIAIDVALALEYLHHGDQYPIVHCDLKPSNVLLDQDMVAHVGDFGIAKLFGEGESMTRTKTLATIGYMAPEYGTEGMVSTSSDVYSYGVMLLELYTRKKPTDEMFDEKMSLKTFVSHSLNGYESTILDVVDSNLLLREDANLPKMEQSISLIFSLAMECLTESPAERINMREIVAKLQKIKSIFLVG